VLRVDRGCRDGKATRGSSYSPAPKSCRARRVAEGAQRGNVDSTSTRSPLLPLVRSFTSPGDFRRIRQPASQRASWPPRLLSLFHAPRGLTIPLFCTGFMTISGWIESTAESAERLMCLSVVCACGDLTEIQIAIWSPDETQYCSVRSWQTLHILMLIKLHYRLRARRQSEERYLPLPLPLPLCASSRSRMQRWEGNPRIFAGEFAQHPLGALLPRRSVSKMRQPNTVSKWAYALTRRRVLQYAYCECYE